MILIGMEFCNSLQSIHIHSDDWQSRIGDVVSLLSMRQPPTKGRQIKTSTGHITAFNNGQGFIPKTKL